MPAKRYLLQVWISEEEREALRAKTEGENDALEERGTPRCLTMSALVRHWIREKCGVVARDPEEPDRPPTRQVRPATDIDKARAALRGSKS